MPLPSSQPYVCGLCRETLVPFNGRMRCSGCGLDYDLVPPPTVAQADAYVRRAAEHLEAHPAPDARVPDSDWYRQTLDHKLAVAFFGEAYRERREAAGRVR